MLSRPDAVVFDLDGTLVDTVGTRIRAWLQTFVEEGIPADERHVAELIGSDGKRLAREVAARAGLQIDGARAERIDRRSGEIYGALNTDPRPLPGVAAALDALTQSRTAWAIATSSRPEQVAASVAALGLPAEPMLIDSSRVSHAKPEPDLLLLAARELGVTPDRCWVIGDATWDMQAAAAAGMPAIAVTAGSAVNGAALRAAGASVVLESLAQLPELLDHARALRA
jgi:HAD superfamily hydrolase (TIGR01509 family)